MTSEYVIYLRALIFVTVIYCLFYFLILPLFRKNKEKKRDNELEYWKSLALYYKNIVDNKKDPPQ